MDAYDLFEKANTLVEELLDDATYVKPDEIGLDSRSGGKLYVTRDAIIVKGESNNRTIQYYGGFEYVENENKQQIGDYVIYLIDDNRVRNCLDIYNEMKDDAA